MRATSWKPDFATGRRDAVFRTSTFVSIQLKWRSYSCPPITAHASGARPPPELRASRLFPGAASTGAEP